MTACLVFAKQHIKDSWHEGKHYLAKDCVISVTYLTPCCNICNPNVLFGALETWALFKHLTFFFLNLMGIAHKPDFELLTYLRK